MFPLPTSDPPTIPHLPRDLQGFLLRLWFRYFIRVAFPIDKKQSSFLSLSSPFFLSCFSIILFSLALIINIKYLSFIQNTIFSCVLIVCLLPLRCKFHEFSTSFYPLLLKLHCLEQCLAHQSQMNESMWVYSMRDKNIIGITP